MLPNEVFALACRAYYEEQGLIVDERNGQFAHSPLTQKECDTGYYLLWEHHQQQGLIQSRDLGKCCFFIGHAKKWLQECDYFPDDYFRLWDIYDTYSKKAAEHFKEPETREKTNKAAHTPEAKAKRAVTRKTKGLTSQHLRDADVRARAAQTLREFWASDGSIEKREFFRNRRAPRARTIEVEFPNGRIGIYSCVKLASLALGVNPYTICRWMKGENEPQGRLKGLKVRETEPLTP